VWIIRSSARRPSPGGDVVPMNPAIPHMLGCPL
jgi:hypothetical protein